MNGSLPFKLGALVRFRQDHIEDEGITLRAGQRGHVVAYDTQSLVRIRVSPARYTPCVRPREIELCN